MEEEWLGGRGVARWKRSGLEEEWLGERSG